MPCGAHSHLVGTHVASTIHVGRLWVDLVIGSYLLNGRNELKSLASEIVVRVAHEMLKHLVVVICSFVKLILIAHTEVKGQVEPVSNG